MPQEEIDDPQELSEQTVEEVEAASEPEPEASADGEDAAADSEADSDDGTDDDITAEDDEQGRADTGAEAESDDEVEDESETDAEVDDDDEDEEQAPADDEGESEGVAPSPDGSEDHEGPVGHDTEDDGTEDEDENGTVVPLAGRLKESVVEDESLSDAYDPSDDRVRRLLWWGLGAIGVLVLLALVAAQFNNQEESTATEETEDVASPVADDEAADETAVEGSGDADESVADADDAQAEDTADADEAPTDDAADADEAEAATDAEADGDGEEAVDVAALQARIDELLANTGVTGLAAVLSTDGASATLTGEVGSEDDAATLESAVSALGVGVDNQLTVVAADDQSEAESIEDETPAAEASDSDPDFTG